MRVRNVGTLVAVLASLVVVGAAAPEAVAAHPTATVTPNTDLVDDQPLRITVTGWASNRSLAAWLCPAGAPTLSDDCDYVTRLRPGPQGNQRIRRPADVIVDRRDGGPVDCRVSPCELAVRGTNGPGPEVRVPLAFDPSGPDPVRPVTTVSPNEGLQHGVEVRVTGSAFPIRALAPAEGAPRSGSAGPEGYDGPARPVDLYQCRANPTSYRDCDQHSTLAGMTVAGNFARRTTIRSRLFTPTGATVDCTAEPCVLVATSTGEFSEAGVVPLDLDPGGPVTPPPTVTVTPDSGLVDGQVVEIHAEHFEPNRSVTLALCPPGATGSTFLPCHEPILLRRTNADGEITIQHAVHATWTPYRGQAFDCRVVTCSFVVAWYSDVDEAPRAPLALDPDAPLLEPTITLTPPTGLVGGQRVIVDATGLHPDDVSRVEQCVIMRGSNDPFPCADLGQRVAHPGTPTSLSTPFIARRRPFIGGGRVDCLRRHCYVAIQDEENGRVRGPRLVFAP